MNAKIEATFKFAKNEFEKYIAKLDKKPDWIKPLELELSSDKDDPMSEDGYTLDLNSEKWAVTGTNRRSVLFGVYHILELMGFRFPVLGEENDFIPENPIEPDLERIEEKPSFNIRGFDPTVCGTFPDGEFSTAELDPQDNLKIIDWCAKNRMNIVCVHFEYIEDFRTKLLPEVEKRGLITAYTGHCYNLFLDRKKLSQEHPEYFALMNGRREDQGWRTQFCETNTEFKELLINEFINVIKKYPEADIYSFWRNDGPFGCECDECVKMKVPSQAYYEVLGEVKNRLPEELNHKHIGGISYRKSLRVPEQNKSTNIDINFLAQMERCYKHALNDNEKCIRTTNSDEKGALANKLYAEVIKEWKEKSDTSLIVWTYYSKIAWAARPYSIMDTIEKDLNFFRENGMDGVLSHHVCTDTWNTYENTHYVFAKSLWDKSRKVKDYHLDFLKHRFTQNGERELAERYFRVLEKASSKYTPSSDDDRFSYIDEPEKVFEETKEIVEITEELSENRVSNLYKIMAKYLHYDFASCYYTLKREEYTEKSREEKEIVDDFRSLTKSGIEALKNARLAVEYDRKLVALYDELKNSKGIHEPYGRNINSILGRLSVNTYFILLANEQANMLKAIAAGIKPDDANAAVLASLN